MAIYELKDIIDIRTGDLKKEDQVDNGKFNLYTRGKEIFKTDKVTTNGENVILPSECSFVPHYYDGKIGVHHKVYFIKTKSNILLSKYLYYLLTKNIELISREAHGTTFKKIKMENIKKLKFNIPSIMQQKYIINIIEPKEELYIKYSKLVDISSYEKFVKTWFNLINIIEPFERVLEHNKNTKRKMDLVISLISEIVNLRELYSFSIENLFQFEVCKGNIIQKEKLNNYRNQYFSCSNNVYFSDAMNNCGNSLLITTRGTITTHLAYNDWYATNNIYSIRGEYIYIANLQIRNKLKSLVGGSAIPMISKKQIQNISIKIDKETNLLMGKFYKIAYLLEKINRCILNIIKNLILVLI